MTDAATEPWSPDSDRRRFPAESSTITMVRVDQVKFTDSPRLSGEDIEHTKTLVEIESELPPIIVHRRTMRVVDGMHRVRAARLRGDDFIRARYFDGTADDAFVLAVRANVTHGLPLALADRKSAALRIIASHPQWSDRVIAAAAGLAARTVAALRVRPGRPNADVQQLDVRLGKDGRVRPTSPAEGRRRALELVAAWPDASLRQIAKVAGVSPETVRDVRARVRRGEDPVARRSHTDRGRGSVVGVSGATTGPLEAEPKPELKDLVETLGRLRRDPALRFTECGRSVLRWVDTQLAVSGSWPALVDGIPPHCVEVLADLVRECAASLSQFAEQLEQRSQLT